MITLRHGDDESYIDDYWEESDVEEFFLEENPEYSQFMKDFNSCSLAIDILQQQLENLNQVYESIDRFNNKIVTFFSKTAGESALVI